MRTSYFVAAILLIIGLALGISAQFFPWFDGYWPMLYRIFVWTQVGLWTIAALIALVGYRRQLAEEDAETT